MRRVIAIVVLLGCIGAGLWFYRAGSLYPVADLRPEPDHDDWIAHLYSSNPVEAEAAARQVEQLGPEALPPIHATFQNPDAPPERVKAALKACAILGPRAAPAIGEAAEQLADPDLTAEAGLALSFMGPEAFAPLRNALHDADPAVRREALRSLGKLKERAPLDAGAVLPLLIERATDRDAGVRAVAATYLGIIREGGAGAVAVLIPQLADPDPEVRRAAATALGSLGADAAPAIPALRKAALDADQDVAREAGVSLVKLQPKR